jgi:hypothetical protein
MKAGRWALSGPLADVGKVFHCMMITAAAALSRWVTREAQLATDCRHR